jgi:hypothetical protein
MDLIDLHIRRLAGPQPHFDAVMRDFLHNIAEELRQRHRPGSLLEAADLGESVPWLWRLAFATRGLLRDETGAIRPVERHTVAVRFLPDYLRRADRFEMLFLVEPAQAFHPNLREGHICLEIYPGEPLVDICESLHALFAWRLRQLSETDALNPEACAWGRAHLDELPLDRRPLFGRTLAITLEPAQETA